MINKILYKIKTIDMNNYKIVGEDKKFVYAECKMCNQDKILYTKPFKIQKNKQNEYKTNCKCNHPVYTESQWKIIASRRCNKIGIKFVKWSSNYIGAKTKLHTVCAIGHNSYTNTIDSLTKIKIDNNGCKKCNSLKLIEAKAGNKYSKKEDSEMIKEFFEKGSYNTGTVFNRINRKDTSGRKVYWSVVCGKCKQYCEQTSSEIKRGSKGCACTRGNTVWMYIHVCKKEIEFLKFGIATNVKSRKQTLKRRNSIEILTTFEFKFSNKFECRKAETEIKRMIKNKPKMHEKIHDGQTETASVMYLHDILGLIRANNPIEEIIS